MADPKVVPPLVKAQKKISIQTEEKEVVPAAPRRPDRREKSKSAKREVERPEPRKQPQIEEAYDFDSPLEPEFNK